MVLFLALACQPTEKSFPGDYASQYCARAQECFTADYASRYNDRRECERDIEESVTSTYRDCEFDADEAQSCLTDLATADCDDVTEVEGDCLHSGRAYTCDIEDYF